MKLSVLELVPVTSGSTISKAINAAVKNAQHIDRLGYHRLWLAEHHNMPYIASAATTVLIGHLAGQTQTIRIGSGGIMLPNHTPLIVAEQFGTLESIYPNRIDLGLGRAPGTDQLTAYALRKNNFEASKNFREDIIELQGYFENNDCTAKVRCFPGEGLDIPLYILGSSIESAYLAAELGLPYAFAAHFAPAQLPQAASIYRTNFKPSKHLKEPYFIVCINIIAADSLNEAHYLSTSILNMFAGVITNNNIPLSPPTSKLIYEGNPAIENAIQNMLGCTFVGTKDTLGTSIEEFAAHYQANEIMTTNYIYDEEKRLNAFEIIADALM